MLLPSALPCEATQPVQRSSRPLLPSFSAYQPPVRPRTPQNPIVSSCRALHNLLGNSIPSPRLLIKSPAALRQTQLRNPFEAEYARVTKPSSRKWQAPRGANKRGRNDFEEDLDREGDERSQQEQDVNTEVADGCSTPKRQRRIPMNMPLGLSAEDFRSLEVSTSRMKLDRPVTSISMPAQSQSAESDPFDVDNDGDADSGYGPSPPVRELDWTRDDDMMLVESILEKLRLSKRDWNNCARKLGRDRDSIGRRWTMLVGEGEVGLRRGGRPRRTELDIGSW